jgi:hypothetical protein
MLLSRFPAPVISQITSYLGQSLLRLCLSGDRALETHLTIEGGITEISLADSSPESCSLWPAVIGSCRFLERLEILRPFAKIGTPEFVWSQISLLKHLKSINLECYRAECIFLEPSNPHTIFKDYDWSSVQGALALRSLETAFPDLESLWIRSNEHMMTDEHVKSLPKSLVSFRLPLNRRLTSQCINDLPSNLTDLAFCMPPGEDIEAPWPETLENLHFVGNLVGSIQSIPPNLTALRMTARHGPKHPIPSLKELDFATNWPYEAPNLSGCPNLTVLHVSMGQWGEDQLRELPTTLTSLECTGLFTPNNFEWIPPFLRHLLIHDVKEMSDDSFAQHPLPKGLETLELSFGAGNVTQKCIPNLPGSLTRLCLTHVQNSNIIDTQVPVPAAWPPCLRHIGLSSGFPANLASLAILPPCVTYLRVDLMKSSQPESLMGLKKGQVNPKSLSITTHYFPAQVKLLRVLRLNISERAIFDCCEAFSSLTELHLPTMLFNQAHLNYLPPQLTALAVLGEGWQDKDLKLLPRSLTDLTFNRLFPSSNADYQLTSACFLDLPRGLKHLELCLANLGRVPDAHLTHLPRGLISISFIHASGPSYYLKVSGRQHLLPLAMAISHVGYAHGKSEIVAPVAVADTRPHQHTKTHSFWSHNFFD